MPLFFEVVKSKSIFIIHILNLNGMEVNEVKNYEAPRVEVVEVEVEKGFATSAGGEGVNWG